MREATRGVHEAIHELPPFRALLRGRLDRAGYVDVVSALHDFHASSEKVLVRADQSLGYDDPGLDGRARRTLIEHDLAALGSAVAPRAGHIAPDGRPGWNIGFSYVLRGSSIGGRIIHAALDALFGAGEDGRRFFRGPVGETQRWNQFCTRLERLDDGHLEDAAEGATAAFDHFRSCMEARCLR